MKTPSADILHEDSQYELIARVHHDQIRDFVVDQVVEDKKLVPAYMVYQSLMFLSGLFFLTRAVILAWKGDAGALTVALLALLFSFTLLVVIHELLHGLALMLAGAPASDTGEASGNSFFTPKPTASSWAARHSCSWPLPPWRSSRSFLSRAFSSGFPLLLSTSS